MFRPSRQRVFRWRSMPRRRHEGALTAAVLVLSFGVGGCSAHPDPAFAPGRCVTYESFGDLGDRMGRAECGSAHTHRVTHFVADQNPCPDGADATFSGDGGTYCLKLDRAP